MITRSISLAAIVLLLAACGRSETAKTDQAPAVAPAATQAGPAAATLNLPKRTEFPGFYLDRINEAADPLNKPATVPAAGPITMSGFAFDGTSKNVAKAVDVVVDGKPYPATYGSPRPDVAQFNKNPALAASGFTVTLPAGTLAAGAHVATVRVVTNDGSAYTESPPIKFQAQ